MMSSCLTKFGSFGVSIACFCMQGVHIVKCIGEENCPQTLGITLICHCGLGMVNFMCSVPMVFKWLILYALFQWSLVVIKYTVLLVLNLLVVVVAEWS